MQAFYFHLCAGDYRILDEEGEWLPDARAARDHAIQVVRELMRARESRTRHYRLDVCDEDGGLVAELPFATVDPTLNHLQTDLKRLVERLSETRREFYETLVDTDHLRLELRAMRFRARGKPYLITRKGERV